MKSLRNAVVSLGFVALLVGFVGCSTSGGLLTPTGATAIPLATNYNPVVTATPVPQVVTNTVVLIVTNTVTGATVTNLVPVMVTNTIIVPVTNFVPIVTVQWQTNYAVSAGVSNTIATAQQYSTFLPPPYGVVAGGILALVTAGLGVYARAKSGQLSTATSIIGAVVSGVEAAGNPATKTLIQAAASAAGVQTDLHAIVQAQTESPHPGIIAATHV